MSQIFEALPGLEVPVGSIAQRLAAMWDAPAARDRAAGPAEDPKATQINFVLHLGLAATTDDALAQFQVVVEFSRRYPSRIVVLCPREDGAGAPEMRAKIFGECYLGEAKGDKRCVEFVILSYPRAARKFLENEVSICLSTDLPLYYWAHRFSATGRLADYKFLLSRSQRVMIDSAIAPADAFAFPWPNPAALRDLAYCRLLPVRQAIGQFLAAYAPPRIVEDLRRVHVGHGPNLGAEGRVILAWLRRRLSACGAAVDDLEFVAAPLGGEPAGRLSVRFDYAEEAKFFRWTADFSAGRAAFEANFGLGTTRLEATAGFLPPAAALGEAMFH